MIDPNFDLMTIPLGYTRDDDGRVLSYRDESGFWCAYTFDAAGRVVTHRASGGFVYAYTYDAAGRAVTWINGGGCRGDYAYDDGGKCTITYTQQEPVAWMYQCSAANAYKSGPVLMQHKQDWAESGSGLWTETPLYTTSPAPAPVPLTRAGGGKIL